MAHPLWPPFDLRLRTERLVLRLPTDDDLVVLAALARAGVHAPDEMPFSVPWSTLPSPAFERGFVEYHWTQRAHWKPEDWSLELMVEHDGRPIGAQALFARDFAVKRTVATGSWLGLAPQGLGFGKEMRQAVLGLAFDHLGAEVAETDAMVDNVRSAGVSRSVGYELNGIGRLAPNGIARETQRFRMTRDGWVARPRPAVAVEGLEACLDLFGVGPARIP
jgi:RimJ/RimL family protein N-acetyltransferase